LQIYAHSLWEVREAISGTFKWSQIPVVAVTLILDIIF
jgi:hypothetical protein